MESDPATAEETQDDKPEAQKRKRRSYDVGFKMEVIAYAQEHNKMKAAREFDIHRRCVQTWCKTKDKLEVANAKRMRLVAEGQQAPAETLEVSISGITDVDGELMAALPVTCVGGDVANIGGVALAAKDESSGAAGGWDGAMVVAVNRIQAEQILNKEGRPGSFLVRPSEKTQGDYALAFRTTSEVRHWKMVQDGGKFYVHPRPNPYNNLEEIIQHFREAVGQETGLVMTPLIPNWSHIITKAPNIVVEDSGPTADTATPTTTASNDSLPPLPVSPSRSSRASGKSSTLGRTSQPSASMSPLNPANLTSWSVDDVSQWLVKQDLGQFLDIFHDNLVDGECLMVLDNSLLKEDLGITALGHRSRIMKRVNELKSSFQLPSLSSSS
jgi:hypothetical protein